MASLDQLKDALYSTLQHKGSLDEIKARIRSEIFTALLQSSDESLPSPQPNNTNLLINELIRDYLQFNQLNYSNSVFLLESHQPQQPPFNRQFLQQQLNIREPQSAHQQQQIPLLYQIINLLQSSDSASQFPSSASAAAVHPQSSQLTSKSSRLSTSDLADDPSLPQPQQREKQRKKDRQAGLVDAPRPLHFDQTAN